MWNDQLQTWLLVYMATELAFSRRSPPLWKQNFLFTWCLETSVFRKLRVTRLLKCMHCFYVPVIIREASDRSNLRWLSIVILTATTVLFSCSLVVKVSPHSSVLDTLATTVTRWNQRPPEVTFCGLFVLLTILSAQRSCQTVLPTRLTRPLTQAEKKPKEWPTRR